MNPTTIVTKKEYKDLSIQCPGTLQIDDPITFEKEQQPRNPTRFTMPATFESPTKLHGTFQSNCYIKNSEDLKIDTIYTSFQQNLEISGSTLPAEFNHDVRGSLCIMACKGLTHFGENLKNCRYLNLNCPDFKTFNHKIKTARFSSKSLTHFGSDTEINTLQLFQSSIETLNFPLDKLYLHEHNAHLKNLGENFRCESLELITDYNMPIPTHLKILCIRNLNKFGIKAQTYLITLSSALELAKYAPHDTLKEMATDKRSSPLTKALAMQEQINQNCQQISQGLNQIDTSPKK
jgi:hypothetical protein